MFSYLLTENCSTKNEKLVGVPHSAPMDAWKT